MSKKFISRYPLLQLAELLLRKDLRENLFKGNWDYLYLVHLAKFSKSKVTNQNVITLIGPNVGEVSHVGFCGSDCQCHESILLKSLLS